MSNADTVTHDQFTPSESEIRAVVISSTIGTLVEWYDFFIFATASALVLNKTFFPNYDPLVGTLVVLTTYAAGFIARPFGGFVFGYLGDTKGRKFSLVATLLISGIATFVIGILPGYNTIGIWAPIALLIIRLLQGFSAGGEQANAILIVCEHVAPERRGFFGSCVQIGVPLAYVVPLGLFAFLASMMSVEAFESWGWRIPFLLAGALIGIGLYVRLHISESPAFVRARAQHAEPTPFKSLLADDKRKLVIGCGTKLAEGVVFTIYATVIVAYAVTHGIARTDMTTGVLIALLVEAVMLPVFGTLTDRFGRKPIYQLGAAVSFFMAPCVFYSVYINNVSLLWLCLTIAMAFGHGAMYGAQPALFTELFPAGRRASGVSFVQQIGTLMGSALALMTGWLIELDSGRPWLLVAYVMINAAISFTCVTLLTETAPVRKVLRNKLAI